MSKIWLAWELAKTAGVTVRYVQHELKTGRIKAEKRGRVWIIDDNEAQKWLNKPRRGTRSDKESK